MPTLLIPWLVIGGGIAVLAVLWHRQDRDARRRLRAGVEAAWGREPADVPTPAAMASIASYFRNTRPGGSAPSTVDDLTWSDLELDDVFRRVNAATTSVGEEVLYRWMRESTDAPTLASRHALVTLFQESSETRLRTQLVLARLGKRRFVDVTDYLFADLPSSGRRPAIYRWLSAAALLAPLAWLVNPFAGTLMVAAAFVTNATVYYRTRNAVAADLAGLSQVVRVVSCARRVAACGIDALAPQMAILAACGAQLRRIEKRSFYLTMQGGGGLLDVAGEYVRIILLRELIDYEHLRRDVVVHRERLLELYECLGSIDAALAVASFRDSLPWWTTPAIDRRSGPAYVEAEDLFHPLIPTPVPNSRAIRRPLLVTGSNASGKSTFLKAVAINAILSQSVATVCARAYRARIVAVRSSMALKDTVSSGESYFTAELKSVRRLLDHALDGQPCLCVIDEVLRGTNTIERIAAASAILAALAARGRLCLAATHDGEIVALLGDRFENVHFAETVTKDGVSFGYRVADGPATSRNAIKLLGALGYPQGIVADAERAVGRFVADGRWGPVEHGS
jgi:hypothetical protein